MIDNSHVHSMQFRFLQTLMEIAGEKSLVIAFPLPIDLVKPFMQDAGKRDEPIA